MASVGTTAGVLAETPHHPHHPHRGLFCPKSRTRQPTYGPNSSVGSESSGLLSITRKGGVGQHLTTDQCSGSGSGSGSSSWLWALFFIHIYVLREKLRRTGWMKPEPAQGPGTGLLLD